MDCIHKVQLRQPWDVLINMVRNQRDQWICSIYWLGGQLPASQGTELVVNTSAIVQYYVLPDMALNYTHRSLSIPFNHATRQCGPWPSVLWISESFCGHLVEPLGLSISPSQSLYLHKTLKQETQVTKFSQIVTSLFYNFNFKQPISRKTPNMPAHEMRLARFTKYAPYLSNRFTIGYYPYLSNDEISIVLVWCV